MEKEDEWSFLRPWCVHAQDWLRCVEGRLEVQLPITDRSSEGGEALSSSEGGENSRDTQVQLDRQRSLRSRREALALFSAVAMVDNAAWKRLLVEYCQLDVGDQQEAFEGESLPRFQLVLGDSRVRPEYRYDLLRGLVAFCGTTQCTENSTQYDCDLAKIAALSRGREVVLAAELEVPVTLDVGEWLADGPDDTIAYFLEVQQAIRTIRTQWQQHAETGRAPLHVTFVLESISTELLYVTINAEFAQLIENLARDGVQFSEISWTPRLDGRLEASGSEDAAPLAVGQLMTSLFGSTRRSSAVGEAGSENLATNVLTGPRVAFHGHPEQLMVGSLFLECGDMEDWVFERMCSALAMNQTTTTLELDMTPYADNNDSSWSSANWQWLTYACFSGRARQYSRLQGIKLIGRCITAEDVDAIAAALTSDGSDGDLLGYSCRQEELVNDVCIVANSSMRLSPVPPVGSREGRSQFTVGGEIVGARLVGGDGDEDDWVNVLVPGFGRCQTKRTSLIRRDVPVPSSGISSMRIDFYDDPDWKDLHRFLALVGSSLTNLSLVLDGFITRELEGIVTSCPRLVELKVYTPAAAVEFRLCGSKQGELVQSFSSDYAFADVIGLVKALSDADNPLSKCVRRLRVLVVSGRDEHGGLFGALLRMLEVNRTLECLEVPDRSPRPAFFNALKTHDHAPLPVVQAELSMDRKLAFLSALSRSRRENTAVTNRGQQPPTPTARHPELDHNVVTLIFLFAATPVIRRVFIR
ncbi:hypothetical protein BBJ28_00017230 [Nothophytophthora sp. Chile5]|nr:hypothetical protein BBJ28_00017230 [Nothophytophthora sp. Chile5]